MAVHANIATAMADMHEHLGQLIAYAREPGGAAVE